MRYIFGWTTLLLATSVQSLQLSYKDSIKALAYGNVATNSSSRGEVWFNVTGFAPDELPNIQNDVGIHTLDNREALTAIAGLAHIAAKQGQWGDLVFLYSAFEMNGHYDYTIASSEEMHESLLHAVISSSSGEINSTLVQLYASTSSSENLVEAFKNLKSSTNGTTLVRKRWTKYACSSAHQALKTGCQTLISFISGDITWMSDGPRNICQSDCCISWSANATFQFENLTNAANYCYNLCGKTKVSCEVWGVNLQGTVVDQCLSNRASGCKG